jgi:hypothetical protein
MIGREAFPSPVEDIPGKSFSISPIEYFLFFSISWPSNNIFPLSLSYSVVGLSFDVTKTSGTINIDSSFSENEMLLLRKIAKNRNEIKSLTKTPKNIINK